MAGHSQKKFEARCPILCCPNAPLCFVNCERDEVGEAERKEKKKHASLALQRGMEFAQG